MRSSLAQLQRLCLLLKAKSTYHLIYGLLAMAYYYLVLLLTLLPLKASYSQFFLLFYSKIDDILASIL